MRKFINNVLMLAAAFFAGTATVSVIEYANSIADRPDNSIGGEVLIIPLMLVILYIGWILAKMYFSIIVADKIYNSAYKKATTKANQNNLREQKLPCNVAVDGHKPVKRQSARKKVKEMSNMEQIEAIVAEAMKCGMSYGEFVAKNPRYAERISQVTAIKKKRGQKQREIK